MGATQYVDDLRRAVTAAVVDDDHFARVRLLDEVFQNAVESLRQPPFLIIGRDDDGEKRTGICAADAYPLT
jgi:hypothetical protein